MSDHDPKGIVVEILGLQHQFACPKGQEDALRQAAKLLNTKLEDTRQRSGTRNNERLLLMVALNLSHELMIADEQLQLQQEKVNGLLNKVTHSL